MLATSNFGRATVLRDTSAGLDGRFSRSLRLARIPMLDIRLDATESVKDITYGGRIVLLTWA